MTVSTTLSMETKNESAHQRQCPHGLATVGLLLIASPRFREMGDGTKRGRYHRRKEREAEQFCNRLRVEMEVSFPGVVYGRTDLRRALDMFYAERVDFILAEFMSWAEDAPWIEFLREAIDVPILFVHTFREEIGFATTDDDDDFIEFLSAGGLVGTLEASGSIKRVGRSQTTPLVGGLDTVLNEARLFGQAATVRNALKRAAVGLVGNYNEVMWSTQMRLKARTA